MLTPDCRPRQLCLDDRKAIWKAYNEKTGSRYVALFNLGEEEAELSVESEAAGIGSGDLLTELWTGEQAAVTGGVLRTKVPAHGCVVYS